MDLAVDNYNQTVEWGGQARPCGSSGRTRTMCRAYCATMDAQYGFATIRELAHTVKFGTCPGYKCAVIANESAE